MAFYTLPATLPDEIEKFGKDIEDYKDGDLGEELGEGTQPKTCIERVLLTGFDIGEAGCTLEDDVLAGKHNGGSIELRIGDALLHHLLGGVSPRREACLGVGFLGPAVASECI